MASAAAADTVAYDWDMPATTPSPAGTAFQTFYRLLSPPGDRGAPVVFLHALRTPSGAERLVVVQVYAFADGAADDATNVMVTFGARVFRPGGLIRPPSQVLTRDTGSLVVGAGRGTQVYSGQTDAADASHFTLTGHCGGRAFAIDGWLQDDETVTMDLRAARPVTRARPPGTPRRTVAP